MMRRASGCEGAVPKEQDEQRPKRASAPVGDVVPEQSDTRSGAKFFLAVHHSKLGASRIYRVYPHADSLSFLYVGVPHLWIDLESARRLDGTHWAIRAA